MIQIGDKVSAIDDDVNGIVIAIQGETIIIETEDGFEMRFQKKELIVINPDQIKTLLQSSRVQQSIINEKEISKRKPVVKEKKSRKEEFVLEIDLHIEKLVPSRKGMSNYDILTLQSETVVRQIDFAQRNRIPKIVFIHGVGEGVLKAELDFILGRYDNIVFQDANYQKYGLGATEVYFKQNPK